MSGDSELTSVGPGMSRKAAWSSVYTPLLGVVYEKTQRGQQWSTKYCASRRSRVHNISYSTVARVGFFHAPRPGEVCIQFTPRHISHFVSSKDVF